MITKKVPRAGEKTVKKVLALYKVFPTWSHRVGHVSQKIQRSSVLCIFESRRCHLVPQVCSKVKDTHTVTVSCYMVELYLEDVNDLLLSTTNKKDAPKLEIKQDASGIVVVKGVTIKAAADPDDLMRHYRCV